jgi:hypothetical protein
MKKKIFFARSLFYFRRFGHLSDHYQYNKLSKTKHKQKTKELKNVDSNNFQNRGGMIVTHQKKVPTASKQ